MKAACLILALLIMLAIMAVCVMVKFATEIAVDEKNRDDSGQNVFRFSQAVGVISLNGNLSTAESERFPYVAAIIKNSSTTWSFACFASVILVKWVVTSAHCRTPESTHRVLLYHDFVRNLSHTYPILLWRIHEKFNISNPTPRYDIAVAKLNVERYDFSIKSSVFDDRGVNTVVASVWKTVATMDKKLFLTNDFENYDLKIAQHSKCYEIYGVFLDDSMICVDVSDHKDCFIHEFGPIYAEDKIAGLLAIKPRECDVKLAIFTNVSYYSNWILKSTRSTYYE